MKISNKPVMIIVSTLFFNRIGNQSLLETVKQYVKKYHVVFITSASRKNDYYMNVKQAKSYFNDNDIDFFFVYQIIPNFLRALKNVFFKINIRPKSLPKTMASNLQNMSYGKLHVLSCNFMEIFLYFSLKRLVKLFSPHVICAYEIFAVRPVLKIKNKKSVSGSIKYIAKFQGTVLGFDYDKTNILDIYKRYKYDIEVFKLCNQFDVCAITNDGTNGFKVLNYFGVDSSKILYEPNGISTNIKDMKPMIRVDMNFNCIDTINLFTLSRLIGWKRVNLTIEIMNKLVNDFSNFKYRLNIYGHGTKEEITVLNNLIALYNLQKYVFLHGPVLHDALKHVYNDNHIMLSLYKYTNVTNPVLEAIFLNKPLISLHDSNLDMLLKNINTDRIYLCADKGDEYIINDISNYLNTAIFEFSNDKIDTCDAFDWEKRIMKEISILEKGSI
ncbi:glycosyltransferase [Treponema pedis]|uniref:Glycosyltransferase n=1 Tax=Treponema pedis TaxID=409322 RepID=A0A7S6WR12_9SPIR|nr:glycosyltransferase [Treponema pedis]QOW61720.1 hypothetical protein IFE08_04935 [Treponema pedis]